jgi:uncharacterized repeat protein (TIGR01451 family)
MRKGAVVVSLILVMILIGLTSGSRAARPAPEPAPPRPLAEGAEELLLLDSNPSRLEPQQMVETTSIVPWSKLVFQSYRDENWEIYTANGDGSQQVRRTYHVASDVEPRLDRGCTRIVFASNRDGNWEIYTMNLDGTGLRRLTWEEATDGQPFWSPDGTKIAFRSYRDDQAEIYVMNGDGSGLTRLTYENGYDGMPAWSPDGTKIAFVSDRSGEDHIWVMNADGSGKTQLSSQPFGQYPAWSPDSNQIAYNADGSGDGWQELWVMNADGSDQHKVHDPGSEADAWVRSWSPGGRYVAFTEIRWVFYEGSWYWTEAHLKTWDSMWLGTYFLGQEDTDWHPDWSTTDAQAPTSRVAVLPAYSRPGPWVQWHGTDTGASGLRRYDVQVKDAAVGSWTDWQTATTDISSRFAGTVGHTYHFRSRATDNAYNVEDWPVGDGDAATTLYNWAVFGTVRDNLGTPVAQATITTTPRPFHAAQSDSSGHYFAYVADNASTYTVKWAKGEYGVLPPTTFPAARDARGHAILPPPNNVVPNWGFESGNFGSGDWLAGGVVTPAVTDTTRHTGDHAALLGQSLAFALPVNVSNSSDHSGQPQMAVDGSGTVHIVWNEYGATSSDLYHTWRGSDGTWSSPQNISNSPSSPGAGNWLLAVDGSGALHVVWVQWVQLDPDIYYARRGSDGTWSSPVSLYNASDSFGSITQLVADRSGAVHMMWVESPDIYYARRGSDGTWSDPEYVPSGGAFYPQLAVGQDGTVHVAWSHEFMSLIHYARRANDGTWFGPETVFDYPPDYPVENADVVVDGDGAVHVMWSTLAEEPDIFYARRGTDGIWSGPESISNSPGMSQWGGLPQVAIDESGTVHVVWSEGKPEPDSGADIYYRHRESAGVWSSPENLTNSPSSHTPPDSPQMVVERNGTIHVIWREANTLRYTQRGGDNPWSNPRVLHSTPEDIFIDWSVVVAEESRYAHVAWNEYGLSSEGEVYYVGPALAEQTGDSILSQALTVPITMSNPTLSFLYQLGGVSAISATGLSVQVHKGTAAIPLLSTAVNTNVWTHHWSDLSPWAGGTITVSFTVHEAEGYPRTWAYLDEVTVGSAYPDLWVDKDDVVALPGEQTTYRIAYGNRGGSAADDVIITDTLPSELSLIGAAPPPIFNTMLWAWEWDVGDLAGESGPFSILITATVAPTATVMSNLVNTASIGSASGEIETDNNVAYATVFVGRRVYLPIIARGS